MLPITLQILFFNSPDPGRRELERVAEWVAEVERAAALWPDVDALDRDTVCCQLFLPGIQFFVVHSEAAMPCALGAVSGDRAKRFAAFARIE